MNRLNDFIATSTLAPKTLYGKKKRLEYAFNFFKQKNAPIDFLDISPNIFLDFFKHINEQDFSKKTKVRYRTALRDYADFICRELYAMGKSPKWDYSYLFSSRFFKFSGVEQIKQTHFLTKEECFLFYKFVKYSKPPLIYFASMLLMTTGMRVGELLKIKKSDINFEERSIIVEGKTGKGIYIIAENLKNPLLFYTQYLPAKQQKLFPISPQKFNDNLKDWQPWMHSHLFRDCLYSIWHDMKVEPADRDILQCRDPTGVGPQHYLKKYSDISVRRAKYDEIYPFRDLIF